MASAPQSQHGKLEAAVIKTAGSEAADNINSMSPEELKEKLALLAQHENETEKALKEDEAITEMKDELKELQGPYKDALKGIKAQRNFIALRLEEQGKV